MDGIYDEEENDMLEPAAEVRGGVRGLLLPVPLLACCTPGLCLNWD